MFTAVRIIGAVLFWMVNLWWYGSAVQALRAMPSGTFRVYSVTNDGVIREAWGLTFRGEQGRWLAIGYLVIVGMALAGSQMTRGWVWLLAALVLVAWSLLFAGNSLWLGQWTPFKWWDWVNFAGVVIVIGHLLMSGRWRGERRTAR